MTTKHRKESDQEQDQNQPNMDDGSIIIGGVVVNMNYLDSLPLIATTATATATTSAMMETPTATKEESASSGSASILSSSPVDNGNSVDDSAHVAADVGEEVVAVDRDGDDGKRHTDAELKTTDGDNRQNVIIKEEQAAEDLCDVIDERIDTDSDLDTFDDEGEDDDVDSVITSTGMSDLQTDEYLKHSDTMFPIEEVELTASATCRDEVARSITPIDHGHSLTPTATMSSTATTLSSPDMMIHIATSVEQTLGRIDGDLMSLIVPNSDHFSLLVNTIVISCASTAILFGNAILSS